MDGEGERQDSQCRSEKERQGVASEEGREEVL